MGRCIYCDSTDDLTREHVIPFAMHGDIVLPEASCKTCASITSGLELFVLKKMFGIHRTKLKYRSRNKSKKRGAAKIISFREEADGSETPIELEEAELPFHSWALPLLDLPALAWQVPYETAVAEDTLRAVIGKADAEAVLNAAGEKRPVKLPSQPYNAETFMRFVAKIAHAYACAVLGLDGFKPVLRDFILKGHKQPRIFVGGELKEAPAAPYAYEVALGDLTSHTGQTWLAVRYRMFSYMGTPTYIAVAGADFDGDLSTLEWATYAKHIKIRIIGTEGGETLFALGYEDDSPS